MRRILVFLCAVWAATLASQLQAESVSTTVRTYDDMIAAGNLKVAVYENFAPYSFVLNGQPRGVDVELAEQIAQELGVALELLWVIPGEKLDDDLRNFIWRGHYLRKDIRADLMLRIPYDREFSYRRNEFGELVNELVVMFGPYQRERWLTAYNSERIKSLETVGVFQYHPVGVEDDSVPLFYLLTAFAGRLSPNVKQFVNPPEAFRAMQSGQVDAVMAMRGELEWLLSQAKDSRLQESDAAYPNLGQSVWEVGMAVHESNRQLAYAVEGLTETMIRDGRMQALYEKYHLTYEVPEMYQ